jgi:hypothetical protein
VRVRKTKKTTCGESLVLHHEPSHSGGTVPDGGTGTTET